MLAQDALDDFLQAFLGLNRGVAQVEARLQLPRNDIRRTRAGIQVGHLERRWLEVLGALVPLAAGQLCEGRRQRMDRVLRQLRVGDVPLHAVHGEPAAE